MNIRRAVVNDVPAIVELAVESVSRTPWPVRIDRESMRETAYDTVKGNEHFVWVAEEDGKIVACVGAVTQPSFWHERMTSSVLLFYSKSPGAGIALLRQYARWVKGRPAIKVAMFSLEHDADPRIGKLLQRLGFGITNPQFTYVRGME